MPNGFDPRLSPAWLAWITPIKERRDEFVERTAELTNAGLDIHQIAVILGVAPTTVYHYRRQAGLKVENAWTARANERSERVAELTRQGLSTEQIADKLNVTARTVVRDRRRAGVAQDRVRNPLTAEEIATVERLLADGASLSECGRTIGREHSLHSHPLFRGRGWTRQQTAEWMVICRLEQDCG